MDQFLGKSDADGVPKCLPPSLGIPSMIEKASGAGNEKASPGLELIRLCDDNNYSSLIAVPVMAAAPANPHCTSSTGKVDSRWLTPSPDQAKTSPASAWQPPGSSECCPHTAESQLGSLQGERERGVMGTRSP